MSKLQIQAETRAEYAVRLKRDLAEFIWTSTPQSPLKGSVDLKTKVNSLELSWLAKNLGCTSDTKEIWVPSLDFYNRLLVYGCVRPTIRNVEKAKELALLVLDLNSWDAHYWASRFRELWWRHERYIHLTKAARAFKLFFGFD